MATINYVTLELPEVLFEESEVIQETPSFEVRRYNQQKGVIFRLPNNAKPGQVHHAFMEHEVNMSNTLRTGTLTMKIQITFIPCHMGVFSGFDKLEGSYQTSWQDEEYGEDYFVPDYRSGKNVKNIVPLPVNIKSNLYEYLNEILFNKVEDPEILNKYIVSLGCQTKKLKDRFIPVPVNSGTGVNSRSAHIKTIDFFNDIASGGGKSLLPEKTDKAK